MTKYVIDVKKGLACRMFLSFYLSLFQGCALYAEVTVFWRIDDLKQIYLSLSIYLSIYLQFSKEVTIKRYALHKNPDGPFNGSC